MAKETDLLAEIWARPDDRQLLGVYADWLIANGHTPRGEYIQLALLDEPTAAQDKRREALRRRHRGAWLGAARPFVYTWDESEESPSFVARAQCSMVKLVKGFDHVRVLGPRLVVSVTEPKAKREVAALAKLPLGRLHGLALYENDAQWITDELLTTIAPTLPGLRTLILHAGEARSSDRGWQAMLGHLDVVEHLEVAMGENPERWLELLLESRLAKTLRTLSVPKWIGKALKTRLAKTLPSTTIEYRDELRHPYNRETGYYETYR